MDALEALQTRNSAPRLTGSVAPTDLEEILKAGLRAPDHGQLRPWRILVIEGASREKLGELFVRAKSSRLPDITVEALEKLKSKPLRAPVILVVAACVIDHPKVPEVEQLLSAGTVAQNLMLAAHALGYGAIWRTGEMAYDAVVNEGLGFDNGEKIVGFIYLGEVDGRQKLVPEHNLEVFVSRW